MSVNCGESYAFAIDKGLVNRSPGHAAEADSSVMLKSQLLRLSPESDTNLFSHSRCSNLNK